jgi:sterol desaturase/sphingolipid hydroxylase (fatty acid hydroxylase superfamily)
MRINKFLYFGDFFAMPLALALFAYGAFRTAGAAAAVAYFPALLGGLIVWTLAEYWIHRTLYHQAPLFSRFHDRHHAQPKALIGLPSFLSSGIVVGLGYGPFFAFAPVFADGFASGALLGYAAYMIVHHATHHWPLAPGDWLYGARVRHLAHHYHEEGDFGVVTGLWDRVFGTDGRRRSRTSDLGHVTFRGESNVALRRDSR